MRKIVTASCLSLVMALAACAPAAVQRTEVATSQDQVCREQAQMATLGRTDGQLISITCP